MSSSNTAHQRSIPYWRLEMTLRQRSTYLRAGRDEARRIVGPDDQRPAQCCRRRDAGNGRSCLASGSSAARVARLFLFRLGAVLAQLSAGDCCI
jgi:hypothetical protein